jgi:hypothetical protein
METILHNSKCHFTTDGRLEVYYNRLGTRLNRYFKRYDDGRYTFKEGEEAIFKVPKDQFDYILKTFLSKRTK